MLTNLPNSDETDAIFLDFTKAFDEENDKNTLLKA